MNSRRSRPSAPIVALLISAVPLPAQPAAAVVIVGDGLPLETAFFQAVACMGLNTTLIGYSPPRDEVIQYEVELKITELPAPPLTAAPAPIPPR